MGIKSRTMKISRSFNLGPYENLKIEFSAQHDMEEGDTEEDAHESLLSEMITGLENAYEEFHPDAKPKAKKGR